MSAAVAASYARGGTTSTAKSGADASEVLGACVVYLGGLNYFFRVDEQCPIVSRIGTVLGLLHVTIDPYVAPPRANGTRDTNLFEAYTPPDVDKPEDQVYDYMDRTLEYRVTIHEITGLALRKHSKLAIRYGFYRDASHQTEPIHAGGSTVRVDYASRHIVDVTEPLVKYITSNSLVIEVFGWP